MVLCALILKSLRVYSRSLTRAYPPLVRHHDFDKWFPRAPIERLATDFERDNKRKPVEVRKQWLEQRAAEHEKVQKVRVKG